MENESTYSLIFYKHLPIVPSEYFHKKKRNTCIFFFLTKVKLGRKVYINLKDLVSLLKSLLGSAGVSGSES